MLQRVIRFRNSLIDIAKPVATALAENKAVVALETTILTHGMPYPTNLETALAVENLVREQGAVPATIGVIDGRIKVGIDEKSLAILASPDAEKIKISRRDFPIALSQRLNGGTTVSGTLLVSKLVGIDVFVTGGIGGVHRDVSESMDISADLMELSRSPIMVVSSGVKSILDVGRTLEHLETLGVCVVTYADSKNFPAFYTRKSGYQSVYNVNDPQQAAELLYNVKKLQSESGILLGVPIPEEFSLNEQDIQNAIEKALRSCREKGISGKLLTPFILDQVNQITAGRSLQSNIALIKNNALVSSKIAVALEKKKLLERSSSSSPIRRYYSTRAADNLKRLSKRVVVIGGSNMDIVVRPDEPLQQRPPYSAIPFILLFCIHDFLIKTVAAAEAISSAPDTPIDHLTQQQFHQFKGKDICGSSACDIELLKTVCNNVAIRGSLIRAGSLTFKPGYPKCNGARVQTYDSHQKKDKVIDTSVVNCFSTVMDFAVGKGQSPNGVVIYLCENYLCEAAYDRPDVVP